MAELIIEQPTRPKIRCNGDVIPFIDAVTESDKPEWTDLSDDALAHMFKDLIGKDKKEGDPEEPVHADDLPDEYRFDKVQAEDYYAELFPGFEDFCYTIMVEEDKKRENEMVEEKKDINEVSV